MCFRAPRTCCKSQSAGISTGCTNVRRVPPWFTTSSSTTTNAVKRVRTVCRIESATISFFTASEREARNWSSRSTMRARAQR